MAKKRGRPPKNPPPPQAPTYGPFKACPFCGGNGVDIVDVGCRDAPESPFWGQCQDCGAYGPAGDSGADAAANWNQRPLDSGLTHA